ncbi:hypothetical protein [Flavobacterium branchiophilum]|uniref:Uncharacterized protein n=1 Tax=Flavobacterium branchiophilum TaxID=55197 RepID=A0A2H3KA20_9FLAO|nr:hypothetical protein [Flavobacterium branchiophilum]PDS21945.1 hypothetical protein B0A77_14680 [Flavobacterium branchiophilum]
MTSKKFIEEFRKKIKSVYNLGFQHTFEDYVLYKNNKKIGTIFNEKLLLIRTVSLKELFPNAEEEKSFDWGYHKLIHIDLSDIELVKKAINQCYYDLYFDEEFVVDFSMDNDKSYIVTFLYPMYVTFLNFCFDKELLLRYPLDSNNRILRTYYTNRELTDKGKVIFLKLLFKWLEYNDKFDDKANTRIQNVAMLEKYYSKILTENNLS